MSEADAKILAHLNAFSIHAMRALLAARLQAGQRGAGAIELGDLLLGLIVADQGSWRNLLPDTMGEGEEIGLPPHTPFFSAEMAAKLSNEIERLLPHSEPLGHTIDVPLSDDVQLAFDEAEHLQKTFLRKQIEPLHLLAAVVVYETSPSVKVFLASGITKEVVLEKLRGNDQEH